ncbi:thrombopoietin isoform X6 [Gasterosteus aculeatus]|uniref:thrombopoietin isoform X1 n=1 Tax=Gasterosteus aculeatus aculeatus TaxID=481459 RepID=UPI001A98F9D9|nr:thrombopoietin isoform X1 [Gasterosteus aculeatus aculeatus]
MADGQSSPPCAPLGVLLLLIGGICSVQAGPTDFWCNRQVRKTMEKEIVGLRADMVACVGADTLDSPVQLPCVMLHASEWENKTLQQKSAEVVEALRVFWDGVRVAKNQSTSECQTSLLEKLERHMANYVAIVSRLQMQSGAGTPPPSSPRSCSSVTSTSEVLKQYGNLLRGKLERLAADLRDKAPESRQRSTAAEGRCG